MCEGSLLRGSHCLPKLHAFIIRSLDTQSLLSSLDAEAEPTSSRGSTGRLGWWEEEEMASSERWRWWWPLRSHCS